MKAPTDLLVWIDLEMSGLYADRDKILEIATIITDGQLRVIEEGPDLVIHQPDKVLQGMDDWNRKHHGESGLTEAVRNSTTTQSQAEARTLEFVAKHCPEGVAPLAGNTIHTDRIFLARHMPELEAWLHYRIVDVSSVKELARRWCPLAYSRRPKKKGAHRALDDIKESIAELRYYRNSVFVPE